MTIQYGNRNNNNNNNDDDDDCCIRVICSRRGRMVVVVVYGSRGRVLVVVPLLQSVSTLAAVAAEGLVLLQWSVLCWPVPPPRLLCFLQSCLHTWLIIP